MKPPSPARTLAHPQGPGGASPQPGRQPTWSLRPARWWRRHFPVRLAVTTAALLAAVMTAVLFSAYAAVASLLVQRMDLRALAAVQRSASFTGQPPEADPALRLAPPPFAAAGRRGAFDEDAIGLFGERRGQREGLERGDSEAFERDDREGFEREDAEQRPGLWEWTIHAGTPQGPKRSPLAWLWPSPEDVRVGRPARGGQPVVVEELEELAETLAGLRRRLAGLGAAAIALVSGVAFVSARRAFAPLRAMTQAAARVADARRIRPETLDVQVPPATGDVTLERLAHLFNAMLARLRDALTAQARFVDDASHELRTPLGALRAELEVALQDWPQADPRRPIVERALRQVVRLSRLADDMLALARYERGGLVRLRPGTDAAAAVREALADVRHLAERFQAVVVAELPPTLPMTCDGPALTRVAVNLLKNAIEASPPGATVHIRLTRRQEAVWLEVADAGLGMKPEDAARAFEPFFRAQAQPGGQGGPEEGSGLGLAIVKAIVQAHGGEVALQTAPGRGTTVRVRLPAHPGPQIPVTPA